MRALADHAARERLSVVGVAASALLHGLAIGLVLFALRPTRHSALPTYRVELVAAPRAAAPADQPTPGAAEAAKTPPAPARPTRAEARARPTARPEARKAPAPAAAPVRPPASRPAPAPAASRPAAPAAPTSAAPAPAASPNTSAASGTGNAPANISTGGVEFPFQGYLRNLVAQVYRRWHPPAGNADLEAELMFFVHRDGSITGLQFVRRSGSFAFDLEAQGAVESAARAGTFGALPAGFALDVLPVSFFFSPRSLR